MILLFISFVLLLFSGWYIYRQGQYISTLEKKFETEQSMRLAEAQQKKDAEMEARLYEEKCKTFEKKLAAMDPSMPWVLRDSPPNNH